MSEAGASARGKVAADPAIDAIVVGSGFGGAVVACRLAEAGYRVVVLERGRRWSPETYPRGHDDPWIWDDGNPARRHGWLDFRIFRNVAVAQGAAVGGGSQIYANISIDADPAAFDDGWPPEITYHEIAPHYAEVGRMMNVAPVPTGQWPPRTRLMQEGANAVGHGARFRPLDLAVSFDPGWNPEQPDAYSASASRRFTNAEGVEQGTCVHLGECDIGCPVKARNTLDLNYLARAERLGVEVRPLHLVRSIERVDGGQGWRIHVDRIEGGRLVPTSLEARLLVLAAGSLGSTELLLRARDVDRTLPGLPERLGHGWSTNGDFLTLGIHKGRTVAPTRGPTITSGIDFRDGAVDGQSFLIEDGGLPDLVAAWLGEQGRRRPWQSRERLLYEAFRSALRDSAALTNVMPWFSQGRDAADGRLVLRKRWHLFGRLRLDIDWNVKASRPMFEAIIRMHRDLAEKTGGRAIVPPTWVLAGYLITPHPLGGCNVGATAETSVVDHRGQVWGHPGLYVADGAIVPEAIGANPSKTIAALAERIAKLIVAEGR